MAAEIRQTIVTPGENGTSLVQIHISDAPLEDASASLCLVLTATLDLPPGLLMVQVQREALRAARDAMTPLFQAMGAEIQKSGREP